jgi:hypothetical protein
MFLKSSTFKNLFKKNPKYSDIDRDSNQRKCSTPQESNKTAYWGYKYTTPSEFSHKPKVI